MLKAEIVTYLRCHNFATIPRENDIKGQKSNLNAPLPHMSCEKELRWDCDVIMALCELKCITSSHFIMVKYRCNVLRLCLCMCVWSSRFPPHPSMWQCWTNQSPLCLFLLHHTYPASSFISWPAFMKAPAGWIVCCWDRLTEIYNVPMRPEDSVHCFSFFLQVVTLGEQIVVK